MTDTISTRPIGTSGKELPDPVLGTFRRRKTIGQYKFIRSIGFGGMKAVLLVFDADTGREVAMAMMPDFRERPKEDLDRFIREARITASLEHPNIIPLYDMGLDDKGAPFFTMKYLRGESLSQYLMLVRNGQPEAAASYNIEKMLQIFTRVCNAVRFAHSRSILHLDIKPNNVSLGGFGEVSLLDWGIAAEMVTGPDGKRKLAKSGGKGTPGFMSPEQIQGGTDLDERADIYSLGALLYAMLTTRNPLAGLPQEEIIRRVLSGNIPKPSEAAPERNIPAALEAVVTKAMAFRPEDRYASVEELREDVQSYRAGFAPRAENASVFRRATLFVNRNFIVTLLVTLIVFLVLLLLFAMR